MERVLRRTNIPCHAYYIGIVRKWKFVLRDVFRLFRAKKFFPDNYIYTHTQIQYNYYIIAAVLVGTRRSHCQATQGI